MSGPAHPTPEELRRWRAGELGAKEALAVSDHLDECPDCAAAAEDPERMEEVARAVERAFPPVEEEVHLSPDQIERWTDGRLDGVDAERCREHLAGCASCRREADDLAAFAIALGRSQPRRRSWGWLGLAASIVAVLGVALVVARYGASRRAATRVEPPASRATPAPPSQLVGAEPGRIELRDGTLELRLDASGGFVGVPDVWRPRVAEVLARGELALPAAALAVLRAPTPERGAGSSPGGEAVRLEGPLSTVVLADRPAFRWRGPNAASYRVDVFGPGYVRVASSGVVRVQQWLPTAPLPRGELLTWKLTVTEPGGEPTIYPAVPAAPAVFEVAGASEVRAVEDARATGSHLLTGLAMWQAGAVEDAARELAALRAANPSSELARRLADSSARGVAALRASDG